MMTDTYVNIAVIFAVLGHLTFLYYLYLRNHCGYKKVENVEFITFINIETFEICVLNTDATGNGMLHLTDESMRKLLSIIIY